MLVVIICFITILCIGVNSFNKSDGIVASKSKPDEDDGIKIMLKDLIDWDFIHLLEDKLTKYEDEGYGISICALTIPNEHFIDMMMRKKYSNGVVEYHHNINALSKNLVYVKATNYLDNTMERVEKNYTKDPTYTLKNKMVYIVSIQDKKTDFYFGASVIYKFFTENVKHFCLIGHASNSPFSGDRVQNGMVIPNKSKHFNYRL